MTCKNNVATERLHMSRRYRPQQPSYYAERASKRIKGLDVLDSFDLRGARLLDLGALFGFLGWYCQQKGAEVILLDIFSTGFPSFVQDKIVGSKEALPLQGECVDFIVCQDVLHHGDLQDTVTEIHRVLKPGGQFLSIQEPCISSREDEEAILQRDCSRELEAGVQERRPNLFQYREAFAKYFGTQTRILDGHRLSVARDKNYGGYGVVIHSTKAHIKHE